MPLDNRRINGPEHVLSPYNFLKELKPKSLIGENELRLDGRKAENLRPSILRVGVTSEATGSAYLECGNTKIICSVYGPRDVLKRTEFSDEGQLYCEFKYAPYSCRIRQSHIPSNEEKVISLSILQALESVVLIQKFPKARLDIFITVIENDGGVIGHALTCAGAAISNAGVEMYDLVVGCTLRQYGKYSLLDPCRDEEELGDSIGLNHGQVTIGMMPSFYQVVMLIQNGEFEVPVLSECVKELILTSQKVFTFVGLCLQKSIENEETERNTDRMRSLNMEN